MTVQSHQPAAVATMLNPALLAAVIAHAADGYARESGVGLPWALSFVVAPMVLHRSTRDTLPTTTRTHLATWVSRNPVARAGLPQRAISLVEPVRAGMRFGLAHGVFRVEGDRLVTSQRRRPRGFQTPTELDGILRKSNLVGRWLSKTDSPATVFAILGVAP
ncbi:three component ABC system middle component [Nocardia pneumoniae]|uniref:three component ABC system middle component n=1 Tax=Nocardia pneumoniae TaxID=228601 RepID=UPI003570AA2E